MDLFSQCLQWRTAFEALLYIVVWYGASVLYSIQMQQFLSAVNEQGAPELSAAWLVIATCIGLVTLQAACCTVLDGSVWMVHSLYRLEEPEDQLYSVVAQSDDGLDTNKLDGAEQAEMEDSSMKQSASRPFLTTRAVLLSFFSGCAALLQTAALQLSGITCFNIVRLFEPCMAATYAKVWRAQRLSWMSVAGLAIVAVACFLGIADAQSCSQMEASGRVATAVVLALFINCCMIGRNSLVQLLPKDTSSYRSDRLQESAIYYTQLLLVMLVLALSSVLFSPATRALYVSFFMLQRQLALWAVSSSVMFAVYNHCSLLVCERVDLVTHSVLTIFKRPLLILASTFYLQGHVSYRQVLICALISTGMLLHVRAQRKEAVQQAGQGTSGRSESANSRLFIVLSLLGAGFALGYLIRMAMLAQQSVASSMAAPLTVGRYTSTCRVTPRNSTGTNWDTPQCGLPLYHWHATVWGASKQNFGDELSGVLLRLITNQHVRIYSEGRSARLLAVGSIVDLSTPGDVIWSTGVKNVPSTQVERERLAAKVKGSVITAMRGPRSRDAILNVTADDPSRVPAVYGDGALLLPLFFPQLIHHSIDPAPQMQVLVLPHYHEHAYTVTALASFHHSGVFDPYALKLVSIMDAWPLLLRAITSADLVIASSLHGVIVAEAFGVPARYWRTPASQEPLHKYNDYYEGTDRVGPMPYATSLHEALAMGGQPSIPNLAGIQYRLLQAFPVHLWDGCEPKFEFCLPFPPQIS